MKVLVGLLVFSVVIFLIFYVIIIPKLENKTSNSSFVNFQGTILSYGYSQNPQFGAPTFTGKVQSITATTSKVTLTFKNGSYLLIFDKTEVFSFDPSRTIVTVLTSRDQTRYHASVPIFSDLTNILKPGAVVTLQFNEPINTNMQYVASKSQILDLSIIVYSYAN